MTVYAPSSHCWVFVGAGHGGCGQAHSRPVADGAPKKIWDLTCAQCEDHLRKDPQWSSTVDEIVETHDEKIARERSEKSGKMDRERQLATAIEQLAPLGELPGALTMLVAQLTGQGQGRAVTAGLLECPNGHASPAGQKFCGQCAAPLSQPVPAAAIAVPAEIPPPSGPRRRLRDARLEELQALARARLLDSTGNRADLITRLSNAGVTSNDLAAMAAA
jgi:hypothetical protein